MDEVTIDREKLLPLLVLHHGQPDMSRVRLRNLVFLTEENSSGNFYTYRKYDYGPDATGLRTDLTELANNELIEERKHRDKGRFYNIPTEVSDALEELCKNDIAVGELSDTAKTVVTRHEQKSTRRLVYDLYDQYPEFIENSVYKI